MPFHHEYRGERVNWSAWTNFLSVSSAGAPAVMSGATEELTMGGRTGCGQLRLGVFRSGDQRDGASY